MMRRARRRGPKGKAPPKPGKPRLMFFDATLWSWPWRRSAPARAAGCEKVSDQPCCVSCDQNVGAHLVLDLGARVFAARSAFQLEHRWGDDAFLGGRRDVRGCAIPGCFFFGARRLGRRRENTPARQPKASSAVTTTQVRRAVIVVGITSPSSSRKSTLIKVKGKHRAQLHLQIS